MAASVLVDAPSPEEELSLMRAAEETGLSRNTIFKQIRSGRMHGAITRQDDGATRLRRSGGGPIIVISRGNLHEYLLSRTNGGGAGPKPIKVTYRTPKGMSPLPAHMVAGEDSP